jgi:citrate lyase subunit beta/citryl-CoA lyase
LVEAYNKAQAGGLGAVEFEGKMIDHPVAQRARALLERA